MNGNEIIFLILTLVIGILGGYLANKKKVPAAFMIGALFAVAIFNVFTDRALVMVVLMIAFSFVLSFIMSHFLGIDYMTSFFATAPGGIMDISLIAYDFKANTSQVALLQLIRLISVISFVPFLQKNVMKEVKIRK